MKQVDNPMTDDTRHQDEWEALIEYEQEAPFSKELVFHLRRDPWDDSRRVEKLDYHALRSVRDRFEHQLWTPAIV